MTNLTQQPAVVKSIPTPAYVHAILSAVSRQLDPPKADPYDDPAVRHTLMLDELARQDSREFECYTDDDLGGGIGGHAANEWEETC